MGCVYENNSFGYDDGGKCCFHEPDGGGVEAGYDEEGYCCCSDDPDPSYSCPMYESDYSCPDCGHDLNTGDCECEDE